jgi:hypothetical protein
MTIIFEMGIYEMCITTCLSHLRADLMAAQCNSCTVFALWNTRVVGSNPTLDMYFCVRLFSLCWPMLYITFGAPIRGPRNCYKVEVLRRADPHPRSPSDCA